MLPRVPPVLFPFFEWCDASWLGQLIRGNTYMFPFIETVHIMALTILVGAVFLIDLRLLGMGLPKFTAYRMNQEFRKYMKWGLITILFTGWLLFMSEAKKCEDNDAFAPKMIMLALAIILQFTLFRKAVSVDSPSRPLWTKAVALLSLVLWFGVGAAGRAIGFV